MAEKSKNETITFGEIFTDSTSYKIDPLARLFPLIEGDAMNKFVKDLEIHGQLEPIMLGPDDSIIDGRNRYLVLKKLDRPVNYIKVEGSPKALRNLILGRNLHRRHLDVSQRSIIGAKLRALYEDEASAAQAHGKTAPGQTLPEKMPTKETSKIVAELMSVSPKSIYNAAKLLKTATPEIIEAVESGKIRFGAARLLVPLPSEKQKEILESDKETRAASIKMLRKSATPPTVPRWGKIEEKLGMLLFVFDPKKGVLAWGKEHPKENQEALLMLLNNLSRKDELSSIEDFEGFSDEERDEMYED